MKTSSLTHKRKLKSAPFQTVSRWASKHSSHLYWAPQNSSGQCPTRSYLWEIWKVNAIVWGFQLLFPILAASLSHPLSKVHCRNSWVPHTRLSLPCTQKCGYCQPKCLSAEVPIFLREKENATGTGSKKTTKECSNNIATGQRRNDKNVSGDNLAMRCSKF